MYFYLALERRKQASDQKIEKKTSASKIHISVLFILSFGEGNKRKISTVYLCRHIDGENIPHFAVQILKDLLSDGRFAGTDRACQQYGAFSLDQRVEKEVVANRVYSGYHDLVEGNAVVVVKSE